MFLVDGMEALHQIYEPRALIPFELVMLRSVNSAENRGVYLLGNEVATSARRAGDANEAHD